MRSPFGSWPLYVVIAALIGAAVIAWMFQRKADKPAPTSSGYYGGVMMNKAGTAYTTEDGKVVPTPPGAPEPPNKGKPAGVPGGG